MGESFSLRSPFEISFVYRLDVRAGQSRGRPFHRGVLIARQIQEQSKRSSFVSNLSRARGRFVLCP